MKKLLEMSILSVVALVVVGCASLSGGNISTNNPNAYGDYQVDMMSDRELIGKEAILGGMIITMNQPALGTRIELVRYELNRDGYPLRNGEMDNNRLIVDIPGGISVRGYSPGDYLTAVGVIKSAEEISLAGERVRVITMDAIDYQFWRDPKREIYYDEPFFNSPAIGFGFYRPNWGFGFGPYAPYYY